MPAHFAACCPAILRFCSARHLDLTAAAGPRPVAQLPQEASLVATLAAVQSVSCPTPTSVDRPGTHLRRARAPGAEARRSARQAADPQFESVRVIFEGAAKTHDEPAGKLKRIAEGLGRGSTRR